jgi:hypothetical protein
MSSTSETGHDVNIDNLKLIIDCITLFGTDYQPTNADITLAAMTVKWDSAVLTQNAYISSIGATKIPIDDRENLFERMRGIVVRVVNSYGSTKAKASAKKDAKGYLKKITGRYVKVKRLENGDPDPKYVSTSQLSFVKRTTNFELLISLLEADAIYAPNEADLKIGSLKSLATSMNDANSSIGELIANMVKKRQERNVVLYTVEVGVIDLVQYCKRYVRSVYGAKSQQALEVGGIKLRRFMKLAALPNS